jgi:TRAP-type C4-dicarboxylate transport system substrate-binding protein
MNSLLKNTGATAIAMAMTIGTAFAENITFNASVPPSEVIIHSLIKPYLDAVEVATDKKVTFQLFTAGQMFGALNTMSSIRDGAVKGGMVDAVYHRKQMPYSATFGDLIAFSPEPVAAVGASLETFFKNCPECLKEFKKNNLVALGGASTAPYTIMCSKELSSIGDLKGLRIRGSIDFHFALIKALGANGVNIPFGDITQSFERGNIDCLLGGPTWLQSFGITDLVKSRVSTVSFGTITLPALLTFQRSTWDGLSEDIQKVMLSNIAKYVANGTVEIIKDNDVAADKAHAAGMKEADFGESLVSLRENFLVSERSRLIKSGKERGAENVEAMLDSYLETYKTWEGLAKEINGDKDKFAEVLNKRIYNDLSL